MEYGLSYVQEDGVMLVNYSDVDWVDNAIGSKSNSSCFFKLGLELFLVSLGNKRQFH